MVSTASLAHRAFLRDAALYASVEQLRRLPMPDRVLVYALRATHDATQLKQLDGAGLSASERDHVLADFDHPASIEDLARGARDPMLAAQLYAAAFGAAGELNPEERAWLDRLGMALRLDKAAIAAIERRLGG